MLRVVNWPIRTKQKPPNWLLATERQRQCIFSPKMSATKNLQYIACGALLLPVLPLMYYQGVQIRKRVPRLPEAEGKTGSVGSGNTPPLNVLIIGESTMAGVGVATHELGFAGSFAKYLSEDCHKKVNWQVHAKSGITIRRVSEYLIPKIEASSVDLIVVGLGGNDAFALNSPWHWRRQIGLLIAQLSDKFGDTPVVFGSIPPIRSFPAFTPLIRRVVGGLSEILGEVMADEVARYPQAYFQAPAIDFESWSAQEGGNHRVSDFFSDGVHPAPHTYQLWARILVDFVLGQKAIRERLV